MRSSVVVVWILGMVLAISHLQFLAGGGRAPGFSTFIAGLLLCYSLPFVVLWWIRIPEGQPRRRFLTRALFLVIFAISLFMPTSRFLPGYHAAALEGLIYFFMPIIECGLIALVLVARAVMPQG